ncbi:MAG: hypothetical protein IJU65_00610 [Desulfovibrio sp.]|nr:hypothetical protein [Desulfovibrio sp.]
MNVQQLQVEGGVTNLESMDPAAVQRQPTAAEQRTFSNAYEQNTSDGNAGRHSSTQKKTGVTHSQENGYTDAKNHASEAMSENVLPSAASLMESLFANHMAEATPTTAPETVPVADLDKLVERILVAEPAKGAHEVRITLGEGMLKGAELLIMRHADGQLAVQVSCMDAASFQTAVSARQGLVETLEAHGERVQVVVNRAEDSDGNEGDTRQRSRGLQNVVDEA